jgi:hypothetical protein
MQAFMLIALIEADSTDLKKAFILKSAECRNIFLED